MIVSDVVIPSVKIIYGTTTGTSRNLATQLLNQITSSDLSIYFKNILAVNMADYDGESLESEEIILFICSTWIDGDPPMQAKILADWINDAAHDFRFSKMHLGNMKYGVFGIGDKSYGNNYCLAVIMSIF